MNNFDYHISWRNTRTFPQQSFTYVTVPLLPRIEAESRASPTHSNLHSSITLGLITTLKTRYTPSHTMIMQIRHAAKIANFFFRKSDSFNNHSAAIKVDVCRETRGEEKRIWNEREKNITFTRNRIGMNGAEGKNKTIRRVISCLITVSQH